MSDWGRPILLLLILALLAALVLLGMREWANSPDASPPNPTSRSRSESSGPIGKTKRIRVSSTVHRNDLPVFITKEALIRYLLAFKSGDTDTIVTTLAADTFPVDDYTRVRVLDYDPAGNGFYKIEVLEGPKKSRVAWVMSMDLRD
jgi:hypothetical protein